MYQNITKILKELRNYNRRLFLFPPQKIGGNTTKAPNCYFFQNRFTLCHIRLKIYIWKTKFSFHKHYPFGILFSRNAKKTHADQSILPTFWPCLKVAALWSSSCKNVLPSVYIMDATCFDECFLFHVITGRHSFLYTNLSLTKGLVQPPCCCIPWKKCTDRSPYFIFIISTITLQGWLANTTKVQNKASPS